VVGVRARKNPSERLHALRDLTARKTKIQDITITHRWIAKRKPFIDVAGR
jgi:hypothetical protein